jgi:hypothetical protein
MKSISILALSLLSVIILTHNLKASGNEDLKDPAESSAPETPASSQAEESPSLHSSESSEPEKNEHSSPSADDVSAAKLDLVKKILTLTKANDTQAFVETFIQSVSTQLLPMASQFQDGPARMNQALKKAGDKIAQKMIPKIESLYTTSLQSLSQEELQAIADFYASDVGKKFNDILLSLNPKVASLAESPQEFAPVMQEIMQAITSPTQETESPSPSTADKNEPSSESKHENASSSDPATKTDKATEEKSTQ